MRLIHSLKKLGILEGRGGAFARTKAGGRGIMQFLRRLQGAEATHPLLCPWIEKEPHRMSNHTPSVMLRPKIGDFRRQGRGI